jgi:hypothetical protein
MPGATKAWDKNNRFLIILLTIIIDFENNLLANFAPHFKNFLWAT